jgi:ankyrin repeat protein
LGKVVLLPKLNIVVTICQLIFWRNTEINDRGQSSVEFSHFSMKCDPTLSPLFDFERGSCDFSMSNLMEAIKIYDIESVKTIVAGGGVDVNGVDRDGYTALIWAAKRGFVDCMKILLDAKADVDKADRRGMTPLHWAVFHERVDCVKVGCFVVL